VAIGLYPVVITNYDFPSHVPDLGEHRPLFKALMTTVGMVGVALSSASLAQEVGLIEKHSDMVLCSLLFCILSNWSLFFVLLTRAALQV
jgi:hypothetical protein